MMIDQGERPSGWTLLIFGFFHWVAVFADRLGAPFVMLCLAFGSVWVLGNAKTHDDFIRELLFAEVTGTPTLQIFFALLFILAMYGLHGGKKRGSYLETEEMKRIASQKTTWQERALGTELSHSQPPPTSNGSPEEKS